MLFNDSRIISFFEQGVIRRRSIQVNVFRVEESEEPPFGVWPHRMSAMLAYLSCTVGIFNISRFAIFSVHFGGNTLTLCNLFDS